MFWNSLHCSGFICMGKGRFLRIISSSGQVFGIFIMTNPFAVEGGDYSQVVIGFYDAVRKSIFSGFTWAMISDFIFYLLSRWD